MAGRWIPVCINISISVDICDYVTPTKLKLQQKSPFFTVYWIHAVFSVNRDASPKGPIILTATGEGDCDEISEVLADDKPMYALYRTTDVVDDITTVKFAYIVW